MRLRVLFTNLDDNNGCVAHLKTLSGQQLHNSQLPQHRSFAICHSAMIIMRIRCTVLGNLHDGTAAGLACAARRVCVLTLAKRDVKATKNAH